MKKYVIICAFALSIIITGCSAEINNIPNANNSESTHVNLYPEQEPPYHENDDSEGNGNNEEKTTEITDDCEITNNSLNDDSVIINSPSDELTTIQDLFKPRDATIYIEGTPVSIRFYPFGEIVDCSMEGMASYVIFIDDFLQVKQRDNLLRATPFWADKLDMPEIFREIRQVPNTTVAEMEQKIIASFDLDRYYFTHRQATEDFPFVSLGFEEKIETHSDRHPGSAAVISNSIKDNTRGGVFVITTQLPLGDMCALGATFGYSFRTFQIIDCA